MDDDIVRILVSTDNHLGFAERDPVRCDDCFAAFEEVLATARHKKVDFVLMAGDMFHENRPSRRTLHNTMELLRKYCLGEDPVYTAILNDQKEIFKSSFGRVNYEDPYQSICLPIFSIHGNHDDPSRDGGGGEALAAMDILAVGNLINYFGKADRVEDIEITPVLIRKGNTNLAIYGLGAIRDERLNRMWNQKKVKFVRLTEEQGREEFFNIFVLHQNRDYGRGAKNCVHESMIPEWMDLVIWGNEHECQPQLTESLVGTYRILQPGSSIASSYSSTESSQCPKHMAFFEIKEKKFRMRPIKYQQVRQFLYRDISLREYPHLDPNHTKIEEQIKDVLITKVNEMILEGRATLEQQPVSVTDMFPPKYTLRDPKKILVRLRVDHEGFPALNQQRFGAHFVGEVANPADVLLFAKKRKDVGMRATEGKSSSRSHVGVQEDFKKILAEGVEDEINKIKIEDLVNETLANGNHSLSLLAETEMAQALDDYIVKKQANAILDMVNDSLQRTQKALQQDKAGTEDRAAILRATSRVKEKVEEDVRKESGKKLVAAAMRDQLGTGHKKAGIADVDAGDVVLASQRKGKVPASAKSLTAKSDKKRNRGDSESEGEGSDADFSVGEEKDIQHVSIGDEEDSADDSDLPKSRGTSKAKGKVTAKATKKPTAGVAAKKATVKQSPAPRATGRRAAAAKPVKYAVDSDDEDGDEAVATDGKQQSESDSESADDDDEDDSEENEDALVNSDSDAGPKKKGKPNGRSVAPAKNKPPTQARRAPVTRKPPANSSSSVRRNVDVINLDEDEEYDDNADIRGRAGPSSSSSSAQRNTSTASRGVLQREGRTAASSPAVNLADDIVDDEDGFVESHPATASVQPTQQSFMRLGGATAGKKRQLPLSFSQSANPSQSVSRSKAGGTNKSLASGWDD